MHTVVRIIVGASGSPGSLRAISCAQHLARTPRSAPSDSIPDRLQVLRHPGSVFNPKERA